MIKTLNEIKKEWNDPERFVDALGQVSKMGVFVEKFSVDTLKEMQEKKPDVFCIFESVLYYGTEAAFAGLLGRG